MKKYFGILGLFLFLTSCNENKKEQNLTEGIWRAELKVLDDEVLPFNFNLGKNEAGAYLMQIMNAEEVIEVDEITVIGDSIHIQIPVFEGYIAGTFMDNSMKGHFITESVGRKVPFVAKFGEKKRFPNSKPSTQDVSGIWETHFAPGTEKEFLGKGIFLQDGDKVTGTFRTTTGDYRYLDGVLSGDSLKISAFDGSHAFLFTAKVNDSSMTGMFYSGNHYKEVFAATINEGFELPSPDSLTFLKEGYDKLDFTFPDREGNLVSLSDERFKGKAVIVQLMGTWCPNCLDETKFLMEYVNGHTNENLEIVALAFESAKTKEKAFEGIERLINRIGVNYPLLLAQYGSYDKAAAQEKLPMLNHVLSYPTTIFIDKKGEVRKIHTGFNGPATGEKFIEFKEEFETFVTRLIEE